MGLKRIIVTILAFMACGLLFLYEYETGKNIRKQQFKKAEKINQTKIEKLRFELKTAIHELDQLKLKRNRFENFPKFISYEKHNRLLDSIDKKISAKQVRINKIHDQIEFYNTHPFSIPKADE